jgi:hypothetical protein
VKHKVAMVLRELHRSENDLAERLLHMSDRHKADHGIHHLARDLAEWSAEHMRVLADAGRDYDLDLSDDTPDDPGLLAEVRQKAGEVAGRRPEPGVLLLRDLRELHRAAVGVSLDWELLAQAAQALKDRELLSLAERCHPDTLRQARWANAMIKELSAQILVS